VRKAVDMLIRQATQTVIVVEAIKLLESPIRQGCDDIWVTYASPEAQVVRLTQKRGMTEEVARQRMSSQSPQEDKVAVAKVVIRNDGSFENTWKQVMVAWQTYVPAVEVAPARPSVVPKGEMEVERARPRQASEVAKLITRLSAGKRKMNADDVMAAFGEKAFLLLKVDNRSVGLVGWQVENLVARTNDVYLEPGLSPSKAMHLLIDEVEKASRDLQCEASLLFLPSHLAQQQELYHTIGYEPRTIQSLGVRAWQEAAQESTQPGSSMFFKQLRKDRVLRPV
jgi:dephospho-CoA kinase